MIEFCNQQNIPTSYFFDNLTYFLNYAKSNHKIVTDDNIIQNFRNDRIEEILSQLKSEIPNAFPGNIFYDYCLQLTDIGAHYLKDNAKGPFFLHKDCCTCQ